MIGELGFVDSPLTSEFTGPEEAGRAIRVGIAQRADITSPPARAPASASEQRKIAERIDLPAGNR
jgi:hypothetical protein